MPRRVRQANPSCDRLMKGFADHAFAGVLWTISGAGAQTILHLAVTVVLARLLSPADFGLVGAAMIVIAFSQIFVEMGVGQAIVQKATLARADVGAAFAASLVLGGFGGGGVLLIAPYVARFFRMPDLEPVVCWLALVFPLMGVSGVSRALIQREMQYRTQAILSFVSYLVGYGVIGISTAYAGFGAWALVYSQIAYVAALSALSICARPVPVSVSGRMESYSELFRFGSGASFARLANYFALQLDNVVVGRWLSAEALGFYTRAYQLVMVPSNLLGTVADKVLFPAMASVQHDSRQLRNAYLRTVNTIAMFAVPTSCVIIVFAPEFVRVLFGEQWDPIVAPLQVLTAATIFRASYKVSNALARAKGVVFRMAWLQWLYAAAVFLGAWVGHFSGLSGVAYGVSCAVFLNFLLMLRLSMELTGIAWREVAVSHARHIIITIPVFIVSSACRYWLASAGAPDYLIVMLGVVFSATTLIAIWFVFPKLFGDEGAWLESKVRSEIRNLRQA